MSTDERLASLIDRLVERRLCFALYRLPWQEELHLVLQREACPTILHSVEELSGRRGFVMAPFRTEEHCPLLLIRPDTVTDGVEDILRLPVDDLPMHPEMPSVTPRPDSRTRYEASFDLFSKALCQGRLHKLVLSRSHVTDLPEAFSIGNTFIRACRRYPRVMIYVCHTPVSGLWMGCTPEILLSVERGEGHTVSLAGTMPVADGIEPTEWNEKNRQEQAYVSDYIRSCLASHGITATEEGPYTARAGEVVHLKTDFRFPLTDTHDLGRLVADLHPTPAVCGLPKAEAYRFIHEHEALDRRYYAGFAGWTDPQGDTQLYVNLRCMEVTGGHKAVLYAGGGILASSQADSEWEETIHKLETIQRLLR